MITVTVKSGIVSLRLVRNLERFETEKPQLFMEIGRLLVQNIRDGFSGERAPDGTPWEQLKPATVRQRKGDAHPILRRSGALVGSIENHVRDDSALVATVSPYAAAQHHGAEIKRQAGQVKLHFTRITRGQGKGQVRFATAAKAKYGMKASTPAYVIRIPARPFMFNKDGGVPDDWKESILNIIKRRLETD